MIKNGLGKCAIRLLINDEKKEVILRSADTLLHVLREQLELTGAKPGCENGDCGACTILFDGWPMQSCLLLAIEAVGHEIITIEGLKDTPIQQAFIEKNAFQCGYCTSGFLINCYGLIHNHPQADDPVITEWLQSNLCRCTGYQEIKEAIQTTLYHLNQKDKDTPFS